jgi:photosystem II stability/assembly factor-like uncharacterized protein
MSSKWRLGSEVKLRASPSAELAIPSSFISMEDGWATTPKGLLQTTDGGMQWRLVSVNPMQKQTKQLDFVNSSVGWAVLQNGHVEKTTDGGRTWVEG